MKRRVLSIFIDESGDFGSLDAHSPFYIVSLVFHDQSEDISSLLTELDTNLLNIPMKTHLIHSGPIIRNESNYFYLSIQNRRKILNCLTSFSRRAPITYHSIIADKRKCKDSVGLSQNISLQFKELIIGHFDYFQSFNKVKIYYDNGQTDLTRVIVSCFMMLLSNVEMKKVMPENYRLFQVADLFCTFTLIDAKEKEFGFSRSESIFFGSKRDFEKNYLKKLIKKKF